MIDLGGCSLRTAPLEESTVFSSMGTPGRDFGSEPVARIADVAWIVSVPPGPDTSTAPRALRSEERRVGKEWRSRGWTVHVNKKEKRRMINGKTLSSGFII